jgi:sugar O-acyltransferase (sialic acid O-acetyltransferase NeuD family)
MNIIAIFGAGGMGKEVLEMIRRYNERDATWTIAGFFDDGLEIGTKVCGLEVLGGAAELLKSDFPQVVVAIGDSNVRRKIMDILRINKSFPTIVDPSASIPLDGSLIGDGCLIAAGVFISVGVNIGNGVLINVGCTIGHDVQIGNYCTINPGARVSGTVKMGDSVFVGVGAVLNNNITIASGVKIGAGSVVIKSVDKKSTLFGNPARVILE